MRICPNTVGQVFYNYKTVEKILHLGLWDEKRYNIEKPKTNK